MDQPHAWPLREPSDLSGLQTDGMVPWASLWESWPPITRTSLPCLIISRTFWSEWIKSRWSPLALCNMPLDCPVGPQLITAILIYTTYCTMCIYPHWHSYCFILRFCYSDIRCPIISNRICPIFVVITHYPTTGNVFQVFNPVININIVGQ
jgi:hypothetical protein